MKFKKPTKKTMTNTAATTAGVVVGVKASKAAEGLVPSNYETAGKAGVAVVGAALALGVEGSGPIEHSVRGVGIGMVIDQGIKALDKALSGKLPKDNKVLSAMFPGGTQPVSPTVRAKLAARLANPSYPYNGHLRMASPLESNTGLQAQ